MGRQQYIARLALGRSAYEPLEPEESAESLRRLEAALSRSSASPSASGEHYVQQFDSSGRPINPASRIAAREMVRAQNDVLATVGVCYGIAADRGSALSRSKSERDNLESVMRENEVGLFIGAADLGVLFLGNWWLDGIRHRVQVFKSFSDVSFNEMFWIQRKRYGLGAMLFAGMPAHIAFMVLNAGREYIQSKLISYLHYSNLTSDMKRRKRNRKLIGYLDRLLNFSSFFLLSPLMIYSILQTLNLLPPYPLFPGLQAFVPLSPTSPLQLPAMPGVVTPRTVARLIWSSITSPIVLLYTFCHVREIIDYQSFILIRDLVTKPDYPDPWSIKGAIEDELDRDTIPGLGGPGLMGIELEADSSNPATWTLDNLRQAGDWLAGMVRTGSGELTGRVPSAPVVTSVAASGGFAVAPAANMEAATILEGTGRQSAISNDRGHRAVVEDLAIPPGPFESGTADSSPILRPSRAARGSNTSPVLVHLDRPGRAGNAPEREPSSPSSEASGAEHVSAEGAPGNRTEMGAEGIELEILGAPPVYANNISASPPVGLGEARLDPYFNEIARAWGQDDADQLEQSSSLSNSGRRHRVQSQRHRVTTLSSHPADVIASHMSSYLATWITLPLETMLQRTIATSFLTAANTPAGRESAAFFLPEIYPPLVGLGLSRSIFGRGSRGQLQTGTLPGRGELDSFPGWVFWSDLGREEVVRVGKTMT
ncbi:hypothetical protein GP486_005617 [Trichoglossum hirsutum]|uniref:Uncharacterized protein n=1 Tax=Trichoglossum hirsutum TaxID=265104 RepID=A0A9P8L8W8_9PEZI|nr:hypothetical protein GP486_005617 [Trichoglossum hirsutum]